MNKFKDHPFKSHTEKMKEYGVAILGSLHAQREFHKLRPFSNSTGGNEVFLQLYDTAQDLFETNIVALAALARANDEGYKSLKIHSERFPDGVGVLKENGENKVLSAREACNKIIHALEAVIEWERIATHPTYEKIYKEQYGVLEQSYLTPLLHIKGEQQSNKQWEAIINLNQWVHAVVFFT